VPFGLDVGQAFAGGAELLHELLVSGQWLCRGRCDDLLTCVRRSRVDAGQFFADEVGGTVSPLGLFAERFDALFFARRHERTLVVI
jgi:hypothetical protein